MIEEADENHDGEVAVLSEAAVRGVQDDHAQITRQLMIFINYMFIAENQFVHTLQYETFEAL